MAFQHIYLSYCLWNHFKIRESMTSMTDDMVRLLPTDDLQVLQVLQDLAVKAMEDSVAATKDVIFLCGSTATHAFLKISGPISALSENTINFHVVFFVIIIFVVVMWYFLYKKPYLKKIIQILFLEVLISWFAGYFYSQDDEEKQVAVTDEAWISEICLWAGWIYQGDLVAEDVSRFLARFFFLFCEHWMI